jgi:hypothetical protein
MSKENEFESNEAKRQRLMGVKNDEEIHAEEAEIKKGNFFANLWYRHKWFIIIGATFLIIAIILIVQLAGKEKNDIVLMYAGPQYIDAETREQMIDAFSQIMPDYNGDGKKVFNFSNIVYQTEEQRKDTGNLYEKLNTDQANLESLQSFQSQMISGGEIAIYLLDPNFYEMYKDKFIKISDLTDKTVSDDIKCGDNGIYFKKTAFGKYFDCFDALPDDTILCVKVKLVTTDDNAQKYSQNFFSRILDFE